MKNVLRCFMPSKNKPSSVFLFFKAMKKNILTGFVAFLFLLGVVCFFYSDSFMNKIAEVLVFKGPIEPTEAIVVLSGSGTGNRVRAGVKLYREGFGKVVIISGVDLYPGYYQHNIMKEFAVKLGVPEKKIIAEKIEGESSTWGEAISNLEILRKNKIKSFILVTSSFHTYRAQMMYEALIAESDYEFKWFVYPAEDPRVPTQGWWNMRTAKASIFLEYMKILNYYIEH